MMCTPESETPLTWSVAATYEAIYLAIEDCFQQGSEKTHQASDPRGRTHTDGYWPLPKYCKYCGEFTEFILGIGSDVD